MKRHEAVKHIAQALNMTVLQVLDIDRNIRDMGKLAYDYRHAHRVAAQCVTDYFPPGVFEGEIADAAEPGKA